MCIDSVVALASFAACASESSVPASGAAEPVPSTVPDAATPCGRLALDPARAQKALDEVVEKQSIAGVQARLVVCGSAWEGASGFADIRSARKLVPGDAYQGGSTTKVFTAVVLLSLVRDKLVSLDDFVSMYVQGVPRGDEITLPMLIANH